MSTFALRRFVQRTNRESIIEPTYLQSFAQLGVYAQIHLTLQTVLHTNFSQLSSTNSQWNRLVRTQVYRISDPQLDLDAAYELMEKQRHLCKHCSSELTLERHPTISKTAKHYYFLECTTTKSNSHGSVLIAAAKTE